MASAKETALELQSSMAGFCPPTSLTKLPILFVIRFKVPHLEHVLTSFKLRVHSYFLVDILQRLSDPGFEKLSSSIHLGTTRLNGKSVQKFTAASVLMFRSPKFCQAKKKLSVCSLGRLFSATHNTHLSIAHSFLNLALQFPWAEYFWTFGYCFSLDMSDSSDSFLVCLKAGKPTPWGNQNWLFELDTWAACQIPAEDHLKQEILRN